MKRTGRLSPGERFFSLLRVTTGFSMTIGRWSEWQVGQPLEVDACAGIIEEESLAESLRQDSRCW
jgi:hypothetical protein